MSAITLQDILDSTRCECLVLGNKDVEIVKALPIELADERSMTFCNRSGDVGRKLIRETKAGLIITGRENEDFCREQANTLFILVNEPRLIFARVIDKLFTPKWSPGIDHTAVMSETVELGAGIYIGPFCNLGRNVTIGDGSRLESSVTVHDNVRIGRNVVVRAGAVIGTDGYGFNRNEDGVLEKFPQIGGVVIEDDVEVGSGTSIARGTLTDTFIGRGTKIDNLCHIAHNVHIGQDCMIIAHVTLCGSCRIGDRSVIAPNSVIREKISIGRNVLVGLGSVVTKDIEDDVVAYGNPAKGVRKKD